MGAGQSKDPLKAAVRVCKEEKAQLLSADTVDIELKDDAELAGWVRLEKKAAIRREFTFADFNPAWKFMELVANAAHQCDHHPDWRNKYSTVWVTLETHEVEGISQRDLALARFCNSTYATINRLSSRAAIPPPSPARDIAQQATKHSRAGVALKKSSTMPDAGTTGGRSYDFMKLLNSVDDEDDGGDAAAAAAAADANSSGKASDGGDDDDAPPLQEEERSGEASLAAAAAAAAGAGAPQGDSATVWTWNDSEREMLTESRARELLGTMEPETTSLAIGGKSFDAAAVAPLAEKIGQCSDLTVVDFSDVIAGRMEDVALEALRALSEACKGKKFVSINLSDNALGAKGVPAVQSMLQDQVLLRRIWMDNDGLSAEAVDGLVDILLASAGEGGKLPLELFHVHNNMMGNKGGVAIGRLVAQCPDIKDLRVSGTRMFDKGTAAIFKGLDASGAEGLRKLDFSGTTIGELAQEAALAVIRRNKGLERLNLADAVEEEMAVDIMEILLENGSPLTELAFSGTELTPDEGLKTLSKLIGSPTVREGLSHLRLNDLDEMESGGAVKLSKVFSGETFPKLEVVELNSCCVGARGALALAKALKESSPALRVLDFGGNTIFSTAVEEIDGLFKDSECRVGWEDNDDEEEEESDDESDDEDDDDDDDDDEN